MTVENTSGGGPNAVVPPEIDRWNWGAFLLTWIWGIGNNTFIALLMLVPFVNIVMWFVLGAKGSEWAWRNRRWESVEHFKRTQRKWAMWGVLVPVIAIVFGGGMFLAVTSAMRNSGAYKLAVADLQANSEATAILGTPIVTGLPLGNIKVSGPDGKADISFRASGPKGRGTVYVKAVEAMGQWHLDQAVFEDAASKRRVDVN